MYNVIRPNRVKELLKQGKVAYGHFSLFEQFFDPVGSDDVVHVSSSAVFWNIIIGPLYR